MINFIRKFHIYLGCFFYPVSPFFSWYQGPGNLSAYTRARKMAVIWHQPFSKLSEIHENQQLPLNENPGSPSVPFRLFILLMSLGFVVTASLAIVMAFRFTRKSKTIWISLILGALIPILLIWISV